MCVWRGGGDFSINERCGLLGIPVLCTLVEWYGQKHGQKHPWSCGVFATLAGSLSFCTCLFSHAHSPDVLAYISGGSNMIVLFESAIETYILGILIEEKCRYVSI